MIRAGVIALLVLPRIVAAQPSPTPEAAASDARAAEAASAAHDGKMLFDAGQYDAAIERFEAAFALVPTADLQFAIAEAYRAKGDTANAVRAYRRYQALKEHRDGSSAAVDASAEPGAPSTHEDANPELIEPSQVPPPAAAPRLVLPRSLVKRRLLLPAGISEGTIATGFGQETFGQHTGIAGAWSYLAAGGGGRFGFNAGEAFLDGVVVVVHNDPANATLDVPTLQRVSAGLALRVAEDTGVGARVTGIALGSPYRGFTPSVFVSHKLRPSETGAIVLGASVSYLDHNLVSGRGYTEPAHAVAAGAGGALQLQVLPALALEAFGTIAEAYFLDDLHPGNRSQQLYTYGGDVVVAASDHFDIVPFFSAAPIGDTDAFTTGVQMSWH